MRISKYQPWTDYLQNFPDMFCRMTFVKIEELIGDTLPDTAKTHATVFWSNGNGHYAKHWLKAGRIVVKYDSSECYAVFKKDCVVAEGYLSKTKQSSSRTPRKKADVTIAQKIPAIPCDTLIKEKKKYRLR